ncbi:MAG TPA: chemotaxis protein CheW [Nitrospiraceae bacterium]|jgi:purine-binding chemotaxis protein CheW|nr:chemotaxis protein CheW [Nitrospiraceae bacterium]
MAAQKNKSDLILDELRRRKTSKKIVEVEEDTVKVVIFSLSDELYAIKGPEVKELLSLVPIHCVPGSPDFIPGVINIRGDIESVIKINKFLGLPDSETSTKSRIAISETDGIRSGIILDSVEDVMDIPASSVNPPLSTLGKEAKEYVSGEFLYGDRSVTILDIGKIFGRLGS